METWFAIKEYGYDSEEVYGPFSKRRVAADFIEKDEDNNEHGPWWEDNWYINKFEIEDKWDKASHISRYSGKPYRPAYCEKMRGERHRQWRKEHPEQAKAEDAQKAVYLEAARQQFNVRDLLNNLQFGQEVEIPIRRRNESEDS